MGVAIVALIAVAGLPHGSAHGEDRMQLGASASSASEFQSQVGDRVFFGDSSAELGSRGRNALEAQAAGLARNPSLTVLVEGHADDTGDLAHNQELSYRRADAVRRRLIQMGVAPERIRTIAFGRDRLIVECAAPSACASQNRRAVTIIGPPGAAAAAAEVSAPVARQDTTAAPLWRPLN